MRIQHILHPEILLDVRGELKQRNALREMLQCVNLDGVGPDLDLTRVSKRIAMELKQNWTRPDSSTRLFLTIAKSFKNNKSTTFYCPQSFCSALSEIDKDVRCAFLPNHSLAYIAFPKGQFRFSNDASINGAYVRIGSSHASAGEASKLFTSVFVEDEKYDAEGTFVSSCNFTIHDGSTISDCFPKNEANSADGFLLKKLCKIIFNVILYIHHEKEHIICLRPAIRNSLRERAAIKVAGKGYLNLSAIRVHLLHFDLQSTRTCEIEKIMVRGHFRWQPHGPARSQLKLIWIDEHERFYEELPENINVKC